MNDRDHVQRLQAALGCQVRSARSVPPRRSQDPVARLSRGRLERTTEAGARASFRIASWPSDLRGEGGWVLALEERGPWVPVEVVDVTERQVVLDCPVELAGAREALLRPDPASSWVRLAASLDRLDRRAVERGARLYARGPHTVSEEANAAAVTTGFDALNDDQRTAVRRGLAGPLTLIWGPPGTGKSAAVSRIVEGHVRQGRKVLLVAPTHVAVDQVLVRVCDLLHDVPEFRRGLVRREGDIHVADLAERYGDVVDPRRALAHLLSDLDAGIRALEEEHEILTQRLAVREALEGAAADYAILRTALDRAMAVAGDEAPTVAVRRDVADGEARLAKARGGLLGTKGRIERITQELERHRAKLARLAADRAAARAEETRLRRELATVPEKVRAFDAAEGKSADVLRNRCEDSSAQLTHLGSQRAAMAADFEGNCRLLAATSQKAAASRLPVRDFDVVVVDEAGMVDGATAFCLAAQADRVILCGDFRQLPAIVGGEEDRALAPEERQAVAEHLARDVFRACGVVSDEGRLVEGDQRLVRLQTQYRMRPEICAVVNAVAYPDAPLRTGRSADARPADAVGAPVTLIDSSGLTLPGQGRTAVRNPAHAVLVREYLRLLQRKGELPGRRATGDGPPEISLALIAPFREQVTTLRRVVKERFGVPCDDAVDTVHRFQGSERERVVVDLTNGGRSSLNGFFGGSGLTSTTCRLVNVALSRAREELVVVGDVAYLENKLPADSPVRTLLNRATVDGRVLTVDDLVPVRVLRDLRDGRIEQAAPAFFPADETDDAVLWDIGRAVATVVLYSPFITRGRFPAYRSALVAARTRGVTVTVVTREETEQTAGDGRSYRELRNGGITVEEREQMHEKVVVVDDRILWCGSNNLLAASRATEIMVRLDDPVACEDALAVLRKSQPTTARTQPRAAEVERLDVNFEEKDEARRLGARWSRTLPHPVKGTSGTWYVPRGIDPLPLQKWRVPSVPENGSAGVAPVEVDLTAAEGRENADRTPRRQG